MILHIHSCICFKGDIIGRDVGCASNLGFEPTNKANTCYCDWARVFIFLLFHNMYTCISHPYILVRETRVHIRIHIFLRMARITICICLYMRIRQVILILFDQYALYPWDICACTTMHREILGRPSRCHMYAYVCIPRSIFVLWSRAIYLSYKTPIAYLYLSRKYCTNVLCIKTN